MSSTMLAQQYIRSGDYDVLEATYLTGFANSPAFFRAYKKCGSEQNS